MIMHPNLVFLALVAAVGAFTEDEGSLGEVEHREYICGRATSKSSKSECQLRFSNPADELSAINDNGCFMHLNASRNEPLELCPLQCHKHTKAVILKVSSSFESKSCAPGEGVGVERRLSDWFMWRSSACRNIDAQIQFECNFEASPVEMKKEVEEAAENRIEEEGEEEGVVVVENGKLQNLGDENGENGEGEEEEEVVVEDGEEDQESLVESEKRAPADQAKVQKEADVPSKPQNFDDLPQKVDTLLGFMFPSYRKKTKAAA